MARCITQKDALTDVALHQRQLAIREGNRYRITRKSPARPQITDTERSRRQLRRQKQRFPNMLRYRFLPGSNGWEVNCAIPALQKVQMVLKRCNLLGIQRRKEGLIFCKETIQHGLPGSCKRPVMPPRPG